MQNYTKLTALAQARCCETFVAHTYQQEERQLGQLSSPDLLCRSACFDLDLAQPHQCSCGSGSAMCGMMVDLLAGTASIDQSSTALVWSSNSLARRLQVAALLDPAPCLCRRSPGTRLVVIFMTQDKAPQQDAKAEHIGFIVHGPVIQHGVESDLVDPFKQLGCHEP